MIPRLICAFGHWTFVLVLLSPTQMQLPVGWAPHGVAVVDADVLPLLDIDCGSDHNPKVRIMKVNNNIVMYIFIKWKIIVNLLSPSKCLLALLMHECSRIEILAYRAWVGVGVTGTWTNILLFSRYFFYFYRKIFCSEWLLFTMFTSWALTLRTPHTSRISWLVNVVSGILRNSLMTLSMVATSLSYLGQGCGVNKYF